LTGGNLIPSGLNGMQTIITDANNADTSADLCFSCGCKRWIIACAYIPPTHTGSISVNMSVLKDKTYAYWFDPTNGKSAIINIEPFTNKGVQEFTPPGKNSARRKLIGC
jgi:hypothetical protein